MSELINLLDLGRTLPRLFKSFSFEDLKEFASINSETFKSVEEFASTQLRKKFGHTVPYLKTWLLSYEYASQKYWIRDREYVVPREPNGYVQTFNGSDILLSNGSLYRTVRADSGEDPIFISKGVSDFSFQIFIRNGELTTNDGDQLVPVPFTNMEEFESSTCVGRRPSGTDLKLFGTFGVDSENYFYSIVFPDEIHCLGKLPVTPIQITPYQTENMIGDFLMLGKDQHIYLINEQDRTIQLVYQNNTGMEFIDISGSTFPEYDEYDEYDENEAANIPLVLLLTSDLQLYELNLINSETPTDPVLAKVLNPWNGKIKKLIQNHLWVDHQLHRVAFSGKKGLPKFETDYSHQVYQVGKDLYSFYGSQNQKYTENFKTHLNEYQKNYRLQRVSKPDYLGNRYFQYESLNPSDPKDLKNPSKPKQLNIWSGLSSQKEVDESGNFNELQNPNSLFKWYGLETSMVIFDYYKKFSKSWLVLEDDNFQGSAIQVIAYLLTTSGVDFLTLPRNN